MFSFYLGMLIPLAGGLYFLEKKELRGKNKEVRIKRRAMTDRSLWWGVSFFVLLAADILTFSRGGYLGLGGGMIMVLFMFRDQIKKTYFSLVAALFGIIILATLIPNPASQRFYSVFDFKEGSNRGRIETWAKAVDVFRENLILGVGLGNYPLAIKATASYREPIYAHDTYLDIAVETGALSLASWMIFLFFVFRSFYRQSRLTAQDSFLASGAVSIVIFSTHSLVETGIYSPVVLGTLMILGGISTVNAKCKYQNGK